MKTQSLCSVNKNIWCIPKKFTFSLRPTLLRVWRFSKFSQRCRMYLMGQFDLHSWWSSQNYSRIEIFSNSDYNLCINAGKTWITSEGSWRIFSYANKSAIHKCSQICWTDLLRRWLCYWDMRSLKKIGIWVQILQEFLHWQFLSIL